ncbi:MAG: hypothetical protein IT443_00105 [Phycisphaeraceae bacterium]|nr:hypothetical protein [Phycisphaeraceae bacterium]
MSNTFWIGLAAGIAATLPLVFVAVRHREKRLHRLQERARAAERLAHLGTLTGGLAHEIKNPLSSINLNIQLIQEDLQRLAREAGGSVGAEPGSKQAYPPAEPGAEPGAGEDSPLADARGSLRQSLPGAGALPGEMGKILRRFDALGREVRRLRDILEDFLRFAGRLRLEKAATNINLLIDELADFFAPQAQAGGVHLRTQLAPEPLKVEADVSLLKQALLNLMINAMNAMDEAKQKNKPHGGASELILRTERARSLGTEEMRVHVIDTGPGIAREQIERIFEPYYSTKRGGTGLGLPTARRIVEEHGGTIRVHSEPGKGSDFVIALPTSPSPPPAEKG